MTGKRIPAAAFLAASLWLVPAAFAQSADDMTAEELVDDGRSWAEQADEAYSEAESLMNNNEYGRAACEAADLAVQRGIKAKNRFIWARRKLDDADERATLQGIVTQQNELLNIYKKLYNAHCGNEPYELK